MLIVSGYAYFLFKDTKTRIITLIVTALAIGGIVWGGYTYATTDKVKIKELASVGANFSLMPELIAGEKNTIIIGGKVYGFYDEDVEVWKIQHEDALIFHNHVTGKIWKMEIPSFTKSK